MMLNTTEYTDLVRECADERASRYYPDSVEVNGWKGDFEKVFKRFDVLTEPLNLNYLSNDRVLDLGCGSGLFYDYVLECLGAYTDFRYVGYDISDKMADIAIKRFPEADIYTGMPIDLGAERFDYVLASGLTFEKFGTDEEHRNWVEDWMATAYDICERALLINFISPVVEWRDGALYYAEFEPSLNFISSLSENFTVQHDYDLHEYTVYIYKEVR